MQTFAGEDSLLQVAQFENPDSHLLSSRYQFTSRGFCNHAPQSLTPGLTQCQISDLHSALPTMVSRGKMSCILWKIWLRGVSKAKARWPGSRGVGGGISAKYLLTALTVLLHLPTFVFGENIEPNLMKVWFKRIEKAGSICWMGFEVQALIFLHRAPASNFLLAPSSSAANTETPQETQGPDRHTETSCGIFHTKTLPWTRLPQYKGVKGGKNYASDPSSNFLLHFLHQG